MPDFTRTGFGWVIHRDYLLQCRVLLHRRWASELVTSPRTHKLEDKHLTTVFEYGKVTFNLGVK